MHGASAYPLSETAGYCIVLVFGLAMIVLTYYASHSDRWHNGSGFLVAWREVPWWLAAPSIAASWIWAPALFVSVQKSYELGLPGIFWFTVPNIAALIIFAILAPRIRDLLPGGYTLPDWILYRMGSRMVHKVYLIPFLWYQVMAVCVQIFVGGLMLNYLTGIPLNILMILLLVICLIYSVMSGLRASIVTDFVQMAFILFGVLLIPAWVATRVGWSVVAAGFGGMAGNMDVLDPKVAFSFGIVTSIGLIAGCVSDQQYWQRAFAIKRKDLVLSYVLAGLVFGAVPILLSTLGFVAANERMGIAMPDAVGLPMIGIEVVLRVLPLSAAVLFVVMLLSGLMSTLDSGMCAASSLYAIDLAPLSSKQRVILAKERIGLALEGHEMAVKQELDRETLTRGRIGMYLISGAGLLAAFVVQHLFSLDRLWWVFNAVGACFVVPTILSLYYDRISAKGVLAGIGCSSLGMLAFIYGNAIQNDSITVFSALFIIVISLACNLTFRSKTSWKAAQAPGAQALRS